MMQRTIALLLLLCLLHQPFLSLGVEVLSDGLDQTHMNMRVVNRDEKGNAIVRVMDTLVRDDHETPESMNDLKDGHRRRQLEEAEVDGVGGNEVDTDPAGENANEQNQMTQESNIGGTDVSETKEENIPQHQPDQVKDNNGIDMHESHENTMSNGENSQGDNMIENLSPTQPQDVDERASVPFPVLLLGFAFAAFAVRKKLLEGNMFPVVRSMMNGGSSLSDSPMIPDDFTYGISTVGGGRGGASRRRLFEEETIPFTTRINDDEWGWESSSTSGDIELGNRDTSQEEDMQMALAMSISDKPNTKGDSWDTEEADSENSPSLSTPTNKQPKKTSIESLLKAQPNLSKHIPVGSHITSLPSKSSASSTVSTTSSINTKKKQEEEEEDIFASMGLSALAKKQASKQNDTKTSKAPSTPSSLAWNNDDNDKPDSKEASESIEGDSNWGDDNDLDDLLED